MRGGSKEHAESEREQSRQGQTNKEQYRSENQEHQRTNTDDRKKASHEPERTVHNVKIKEEIKMDEETREEINSMNQNGWENPEKTMKQIEQTLDEFRVNAGMGENEKMKLLDLGNGQKHDFLVLDKNDVELGTFKVDKDGKLEVNINDKALTDREVKKEVINNRNKFLHDMGATTEERKIAQDMMAKFMTKKEPEMSSADKDGRAAKSFEQTMGNLNKQYDKMLENAAGNKQMTRQIEKMRKEAMEAAKQPTRSRKDVKQELNSLKKEISELQKSLNNEIAVTRINGYDPGRANRIERLGNEITEKSIEACEKAAQIPTLKQDLKNGFEKTKEVISKGCDKVMSGFKEKIEAGKTALGKMADTVGKANEKFMAIGDTAYTSLSEKIEDINRGYIARTYAADKSIADNLTKMRNGLEKSYERQANVKGALQDVWRAMKGQERTGAKAEFSDRQKAMLGNLNKMIQGVHKEMDGLEKEFNLSRDVSKILINEARDHRREAGLDKSNTLEKMIEKAQQQAIQNPKVRTKKVDMGLER